MDEKKIEVMEGELKLLKSEVKESLVNARDFLSRLRLPVQFRDLDGADNQLGLRGALAMDSDGGMPRSPSRGMQQPRTESPSPGHESAAPQPGKPDSGVGMNKTMSWDKGTPRQKKPLLGFSPPRNAAETTPEAVGTPEKVEPHMHLGEPKNEAQDEGEENKEDKMRKEAVATDSQVNLLANLVRWVSVARNEIGNEKLRTFLQIYAIGGDLPPDLQQVILHLAEVVVPPVEEKNTADVWSRLLLELHGILTGGGTSLRPLRLPGQEAPAEEHRPGDAKSDKSAAAKSDRPVRLKLVVPEGENGEKEFDIEEFSVNLD